MKILVLGSRGMVGSAICRRLQHEDVEVVAHTRHDADLLSQDATRHYMTTIKPDAIILAAAKDLGWSPEITLEKMVKEMVDSDLQLASS